MPLHLDDLPPALRAKVQGLPATERKARPQFDMAEQSEWECQCGERLASLAACARHSGLGAGHRRIGTVDAEDR